MNALADAMEHAARKLRAMTAAGRALRAIASASRFPCPINDARRVRAVEAWDLIGAGGQARPTATEVMQRAPIEIAAAEIERLELLGGKLENLLAKLEHRAPIGIWRGESLDGTPLVCLLDMNPDAYEAKEICSGSTLEEAIGRL